MCVQALSHGSMEEKVTCITGRTVNNGKSGSVGTATIKMLVKYSVDYMRYC